MKQYSIIFSYEEDFKYKTVNTELEAQNLVKALEQYDTNIKVWYEEENLQNIILEEL